MGQALQAISRRIPPGHRLIAAVLLPAIALECTPTSRAAEYAEMICPLSAVQLVEGVRQARQLQTPKDELRRSITFMVPNGSPPGDLERAHQMTKTIVDILYMVPLDALNSTATPPFIATICEAYWPDRVPADD